MVVLEFESYEKTIPEILDKIKAYEILEKQENIDTIEEMDAMVKTLEYDEKKSLIPSAPKPSTRSSPRKKVLILDIDHHQ